MREKKTQVSTAAELGGPGPGKYILRTTVGFINHDTTKYRNPAYSFGQNLIGDTFKTPPSATHSPEKNYLQTVAPKDVMSPRTKYRKKDPIPCPNKHSLPSVLENHQPNKAAPDFSYQNINNHAEDLAKTPGPGRYGAMHPDKKGNKAARYTTRSKICMPGDTTRKPGPGQHKLEKATINRRAAPRCTFGIKHSDSACIFYG